MDSEARRTQTEIAKNLKSISEQLAEQNRLLSEVLKYLLRQEGK